MPTPGRKPLQFLTAPERLLMWAGLGQFLLATLFFALGLALGGTLGDRAMRAAAIAFISSVVTFVGYSFIHWRSRAFLLERGFRVCIFCGYDLRATECSTCPECGQTIDTFRMRSHWENRYPEWKEVRGSR